MSKKPAPKPADAAPRENYTERTMLRMRPSQRAHWARAAAAMTAKLGVDVDEAEFLRAAADEFAKRWVP